MTMDQFKRLMVAVTAIAMAPGAALAQGGQAAPVVVEAVTLQQMTQTQPVIGRVVTLQSSIIASDVAGGVEAVTVVVGDQIDAGKIMVSLSLGRLKAAVTLAEAEVEQAKSRLESVEAAAAELRQNHERLESLQGSASFSQASFDQLGHQLARAVALVGEARAGKDRADTALALARIDLDAAEIEAPFPGVVIERHVEVGEYVQVGEDVVTLLNDQAIEIEAAVPSDRMRGLSVGGELSIVFGSETATAILRAIVPVEDSLSRTQVVRLTPAFAEGASPAIGAPVTVHVPLGQSEEVVTVSKDAIVNGPMGQIVFVVTDGVVQPRPVAIGRSEGHRFEIVQGLGPGEIVVIRGNEELRPGQEVEVVGGGPEANAEPAELTDG